MHDLITKVPLIDHKEIIVSDSRILTIGSCFAEHMGGKLSKHRFSASVNPFGTIFNPTSISQLIGRVADRRVFLPEDIYFEKDRYFHYDLHTSFDRLSIEEIIDAANLALDSTHTFLGGADVLILTFGSAIAYHHHELDRIVSNCHKVSAAKFQREMLTVGDMQAQVAEAIDQLRSIRPNLQIILTVSPVRHTKEGFIDNNVSKGRLLDLCQRLVGSLTGVSYFPAYEIMMDELRDYRYYKEDMIHPSDLSVRIIWERFVLTYFSDSAIQMREDIGKLNRAVAHRPFHPESDGYQRFCAKQLARVSQLQAIYQHIDFKDYMAHFNRS